MKYLYYAKKAGTKIVVINPYQEPGLQRYWVPSVTESALFGTKLADDYFQIHPGGDIPFFYGVMKHLIENDWVDHDFVNQRTVGWSDLEAEGSLPSLGDSRARFRPNSRRHVPLCRNVRESQLRHHRLEHGRHADTPTAPTT